MAKQPLKKKDVKVTDKMAAIRAFKEKNGLIGAVEKEPKWRMAPPIPIVSVTEMMMMFRV